MSQDIYDEQFGAQSVQLFGCSLKSISMQMGFDNQPTVITVVVIEENNQNFTLESDDIQSIQHIQFGSLDVLGIVQSWENTTIDVAGTGVYTVKLTDCRQVLDSAVIITNPANNWQTDNFGVDQIPSGTASGAVNYGENVIAIPIPTEHDFDYGLPFANVKEHLGQAVLYYGNDIFEIDVDDLEVLPYTDTGRGAPVRIDGPVRSISEVISEICQQFGYQWWVECARKSVTDSTVIIKVKIISRIQETASSVVFNLDALAALHPNAVISRRDGYENKNEITKTILQGGIRRQLLGVPEGQISQFWGWDQSGIAPRPSPGYQDPAYDFYRIIPTSIYQMRQAINGELDNTMDANRLTALKGYANSHWGKMFYLHLSDEYLDTDGKSWVKSMPAGWWEGDAHPDNLSDEAFFVLCSDDGRWKPFVKFPRTHRPWDDSVLLSTNATRCNGNIYTLCSLKQIGKYVVMDLSVPIKYITSASNESKKVNCASNVQYGWIPFMDSREFDGPWSSDVQTPPRFQKRGKTVIKIDSDLVPWKYGFRGILNSQGMDELNWIAEGRIHARTIEQQIINTGQLEVADIPKVNIGQTIYGGSNITNISTQFTRNGITTRYSMNLYTGELGNFRQLDRKRVDEFIRLLRAIQAKVTYKKDDNINDEFKTLLDKHGLAGEPSEKPGQEGGMGIIVGAEGGPYYSITRTSYHDFNSYLAGISAVFGQANWSNVRNLAEPLSSPGYLPIGTQVTVQIFSENESGPYIPYIEQTPQVFSPPPLET